MGNHEAILLLDCGTSGVKSSLLPRPDNQGDDRRLLPSGKIATLANDGALGLKRVWQPVLLLRQVTDALLTESQRARDRGLKIVGVGVTSTASSTVALSGSYILPMPPSLRWDDQQSRMEADELEQIRKETGSMPWMEPIMPDSGISKAVWLIRNYPEEFTASGSIIAEQWTFLNWFLTEKIVQCETILGRKWGQTTSRRWSSSFKTGLGNLLKKGTFPQQNTSKAYAEFERHALYGEVKSAGDEIGAMAWKLSENLALQAQPRVFAAPLDTFTQIIGMGMVEPSNNIGITFGTSQGICAILGDELTGASAPLASIPDAPIRGASMFFDGIASCGGAITFVCENYGFVDQDGRVDRDEINRCLLTTEPGAQGIMMLPYYNGGRRVSRGAQVDGKIEGLNQGKDQANIIRALFESIAFITRGIVDDFEQVMGRRFDKVLASGGPTRNRLFMQILASVLNREVVLFKHTDTSLVGCAICVAKGLGWYDSLVEACDKLVETEGEVTPDRVQVKTYENLYKEYHRRFSGDIPLRS